MKEPYNFGRSLEADRIAECRLQEFTGAPLQEIFSELTSGCP